MFVEPSWVHCCVGFYFNSG